MRDVRPTAQSRTTVLQNLAGLRESGPWARRLRQLPDRFRDPLESDGRGVQIQRGCQCRYRGRDLNLYRTRPNPNPIATSIPIPTLTVFMRFGAPPAHGRLFRTSASAPSIVIRKSSRDIGEEATPPLLLISTFSLPRGNMTTPAGFSTSFTLAAGKVLAGNMANRQPIAAAPSDSAKQLSFCKESFGANSGKYVPSMAARDVAEIHDR
jgi:hypothetical protein